MTAIVFDLDDTLYAERDYVRSGYAAVGRRLKSVLGRREDFAGWLWARFLSGQCAGAFDAINAHFHLGLSAEQIHELVTVYREHPPTIQPYGGVPEMLGRLRGRYRVGVLSDGFLPAQRLKLDALALGRFVDAVVFNEELGREFWKPSPMGFEAVARQLGAEHAACVYVSDNPAKDFVAPNALGWRTIQFRRSGQVHAGNPVAPGGAPQTIVRDDEQLWRALL